MSTNSITYWRLINFLKDTTVKSHTTKETDNLNRPTAIKEIESIMNHTHQIIGSTRSRWVHWWILQNTSGRKLYQLSTPSFFLWSTQRLWYSQSKSRCFSGTHSRSAEDSLGQCWALLCYCVGWVQLCGGLSILRRCLSLGLEWKLTFSSPVATAESSKFAGIFSAAP